MHLDSYKILEASSDLSVYKFTSVGPKGNITKYIIFSEIDSKDKVYNLALVDAIGNDIVSDTRVSNNGDMRKVLATVAQIVGRYTSVFPERTIFFQGSDREGKRLSLYHRAIHLYYPVLEKDFIIKEVLIHRKIEKFRNKVTLQYGRC